MAPTSRPASRLEIPKYFGRRPDAAFLPAATPEEQAAVGAARIQHQAALAVLDELTRRGLALGWLAEQVGENADHLRRKLHGRVPASLRDLCAWGISLEITTVVPVNDVVGAP